jgi:hypothetical protein
MTTTAPASSYAPRGVEKDKPITVRFMPDERAQLVDEAAKESRSTGAFTRLMTIKGLEAWKAEKLAARAQGN